jgi:hypothetical protein
LPKLTARSFVRYWLPAICWLTIIAIESTSLLSAHNTSGIIEPILRWLFPRFSPEQIDYIHGIGRKVGHFAGYGILSYFFFRAFRGTYHIHQGTEELLRHKVVPAGQRLFEILWRSKWALLALLFTFAVASADEIHQMSLPSRTGTWWDVLLDTTGAAIIQLIILAIISARSRRSLPVSS